MGDKEIEANYKIEKVSEQEKAILFDYKGMEEDNKITEILRKAGF